MMTLNRLRSVLMTGAAVFAIGLTFAATGRADSMSLTNTVGGLPSVTINPGDTFSFNINYTTAQSSTGLTYFLSAGGLGSNSFTVSGRNVGVSLYSDPDYTNAQVTDATAGRLDPTNDLNLGGSVANPSAPIPSGTQFVATITLQSLPGIAPGSYTLQSFNTVGSDANFNDVPVNTEGLFTVNVVPEPSVVWLLGAAGVSLFVVIRRRGFQQV